MASDVEDLTTLYANFPSIFENNSSCPIEPSYDVNTDKSYQPMFGSFLFADSDSLNRAAFVLSSSSSSIDDGTTEEQLMADSTPSNEKNLSSGIQTTPSSHPSLVPDDDIDEDDFDGIPIRHAPATMIKTLSHSNHTQSTSDDHDLEDEAFLNGFTDEQHQTTATVPSLFKDIPDIDDLDEHDEDDGVPFDHMDMLDQSDSIRSSSPDSLLSSSHLLDEQDVDDDNTDDEVAQWNDDIVLNTTSTNTNSQVNLPLVLSINPADQVNFIDSSRSNSRCSDISSHLSIGYADQAHVFMSDDELVTSSDSESDDAMEVVCDNVIGSDHADDDEELCLQVNLDDRRSSFSSDRSNSTRSSSPIVDETPIVDMDEDNPPESKTSQIAPIAALDDDEDMEESLSDRPILPTFSPSIIETFVHYKTIQRQNDIAHDIIQMRHVLEDNEHDDEFLAIMHNPSIFEQVLSDYDDQKKSELVKQGNSLTDTFRPSSQLWFDNKIKRESLEHCQHIPSTSSSFESDHEKIPSLTSSSKERTTVVNSFFPSVVNHLPENEGKEKDATNAVNVVNTTDTSTKKQKKDHLHNTPDIDVKQLTNGREHSPTMSTDSDDSELLQTLSQLHNVIHTVQSSGKVNQAEVQLSSDSLGDNQRETFSHFSSANTATNGNEREFFYKKTQPPSLFVSSSSPHISDKIKKSVEEHEEESDEKKNGFFYQNHNTDEEGDAKQKEKYEKREEREEKTLAILSSLTSRTSPTSFIDDSRLFLDPETSSLLPNLPLISSNQLNESSAIANQSITARSQTANTKSNMNDSHNHNQRTTTTTTTSLFDPFAPTTTNMLDDVTTGTDTNNPFGIQSNSSSTQPLADYNFDDLWNQSISHIDTTNKSSALAWETLLNNTEAQPMPTTSSDLTWETLFDEKPEEKNDLTDFLHWIINHLDDHEPSHSPATLPFMSIHNLESIIKDIQMCDLPFTPIPSPPLHVDHTVANPLINAMHHDLFPIDELEQPNISQAPSSMIIYEEDEEEENEERTFDDQVQPLVENLIETILQSALTEVNQSYYDHVEHFVDQIIAEAIWEVYNDEQNLSQNQPTDVLPTDNLSSIVTWHEQKATPAQSLDPFDQKFDSIWSSHFQTPDDEQIFENKTDLDPWSSTTTTNSKKNYDPMLFFEDSEAFPTNKQLPQIEDDQVGTLSDDVPTTLLTSPSNAQTSATNRMKYTLTAPVPDDSGDDSSILDDSLTSFQNKSSPIITEESNDKPPSTERKEMNVNERDSLFSNKSRLSLFEAFPSDQPLTSSKIESTTTLDDSNPWTSIEKSTKSTGIGDDEPWELEDSTDEKLLPIPTTTRLTSPFNDEEYSATEKLAARTNFFADSFNPPVTIEKRSNKDNDEDEDETSLKHQGNEQHELTLTKSVRFDDHVQSIRPTTPPTYDLEESESSTTSDSDEDITPRFKTDDHPLDTSFVNVDKTDVQMDNHFEAVELKAQPTTRQLEKEDVPSPSDDSRSHPTTSNENIPLKSTNTGTQLQSHPRSEVEITPMEASLTRTNQSGMLIFIICIDRGHCSS